MCFVCRGFIITILLLRAPSFKGRGVPPATSYLSRYLHPLSRFFFLSRCAASPTRLRAFLSSSLILLLSLYLFSFSFSLTADPLRRALSSLPLFLSSFTSPLFIIYPLFSLQRPFILPARRAALARKACKISSEKIKSRVHLSTRHRSNSYSI